MNLKYKRIKNKCYLIFHCTFSHLFIFLKAICSSLKLSLSYLNSVLIVLNITFISIKEINTV